MNSTIREVFLAVAILGLIFIAVIDPGMRYLSLFFAVIGVGLLLRRRQRRSSR